nr:zinc finger protein DPF3-like [Danio rerio]|eukprot:XP_021323170.1 zinc finger protein DPF3-like [Danio rerio]
MLMAKQVVEQFPKIPENIDITPSKEMMCEYRKNLAEVILLASVSTAECCSVCGKHNDQSQDECIWIQCKVCQRWFHLYCLRMILPPEEQPWICELCL